MAKTKFCPEKKPVVAQSTKDIWLAKLNAQGKWDYWDTEDSNSPNQQLKQIRKNFIPRNNSFVCDSCNNHVPPAQGTFRNHCPLCLTSKHVDDIVPGDRASDCQGIMPTINYIGSDPDKLDLIQQCQKCRKKHHNRTSPDDNVSQLFNESFFTNNT